MKGINFKARLNFKKWGDQLWEVLKAQRLPLLFMLGLFVTLTVFIKALILPGIKKMVSLRREIISTNRKISEVQAMLQTHPEIEKEILILDSRKKKLLQDFPPENNFFIMAQRILSELEEQEIKLVNFKYLYKLNDDLPAGFKKYGLELELACDYLKFGKALEKIEKDGIRVLLDELDISKVTDELLRIKVKMDFILREEKRK